MGGSLMAAVKTRRRRGTRTEPKPGKESWQIVGPDGAIIQETNYGEGATLSIAQNLAQEYDEEVTLIVRVKSLFGEPDNLFRVVREEDGAIATWRV
jgi:hypothetical protein